jgi:hypothetical protein
VEPLGLQEGGPESEEAVIDDQILVASEEFSSIYPFCIPLYLTSILRASSSTNSLYSTI